MLVYYIFVFFVCQVFFVVSCEFRFNKVYPTGKLQTQIRFTLRFIPYRRLRHHFQPLLSLCDISSVSTEEFTPKKEIICFFHTSEEESDVCRFAVTSALSPIVGFAATSPEGGSVACRFATTPVSTEEFAPKKGNNMFFHTSEEESGVCRFAVTSALSPIVGFAATSPEGGSVACRFAIHFRFSGFREKSEDKSFDYHSKIFTLTW